MKKLFILTMALAAAGCASGPKAYDEQFAVSHNAKGQATAWAISAPRVAPSRWQSAYATGPSAQFSSHGLNKECVPILKSDRTWGC